MTITVRNIRVPSTVLTLRDLEVGSAFKFADSNSLWILLSRKGDDHTGLKLSPDIRTAVGFTSGTRHVIEYDLEILAKPTLLVRAVPKDEG